MRPTRRGDDVEAPEDAEVVVSYQADVGPLGDEFAAAVRLRPVADEVAADSFGGSPRVGELHVASSALELEIPTLDLVVDELTEFGLADRAGRVDDELLGPLVDGDLDLRQRGPLWAHVGGFESAPSE